MYMYINNRGILKMCWGKLIKIEKMLLNWYLVGVWNLLNSVRNDIRV